MPIQEGFAAALRLIRTVKGLKQKDLTGAVTGSHVSQLESGKTTPTLKAASDLAQALDLSPSALIAAAMACDSQVTPRAVLVQAISDLEKIGLADEIPPVSADELASAHPTSLKAAAIRAQVQELKSQGLKQVDVAKELELPKSTVQRHWH